MNSIAVAQHPLSVWKKTTFSAFVPFAKQNGPQLIGFVSLFVVPYGIGLTGYLGKAFYCWSTFS